MKVSKENAVALLIALGFSKAAGWKTSKMAEKLSLVPDNVKKEQVPEDFLKLYNELCEAKGKVEIEGQDESDSEDSEDRETPEKEENKNKVKTKEKSKSKEKSARGESKCGYIDSLLVKGGHTLREIADLAHKKFGGNAKATLSTVRVRPSHMRAKGLKPKWNEEEKETAKKNGKKK